MGISKRLTRGAVESYDPNDGNDDVMEAVLVSCRALVMHFADLDFFPKRTYVDMDCI